MPSFRYQDVYERVAVPLTDRDWPGNRLAQAPLWVPVDLRDGNQALGSGAELRQPSRAAAGQQRVRSSSGASMSANGG
jgi:2-isopropylmalate synthase